MTICHIDKRYFPNFLSPIRMLRKPGFWIYSLNYLQDYHIGGSFSSYLTEIVLTF